MRPLHVLSIVLAGGQGKRLAPLTADRAKPAVPYGGNYRLVDFVLSNLVNGGNRKIVVLTQYKSHSLDRHIALTWRLSPLLGAYVTPVPAQMRRGPYWFEGSADAIFQNLNLVHDERPDLICVFGADHIYRMDPQQMIEHHLDTGAGVTVAGLRVPVETASEFGIIRAGESFCIDEFLEKPSQVPEFPGSPGQALASMGNYVFSTDALIEAVSKDSENDQSNHDIGGDIIPMMVRNGDAAYYDFQTNEVPGVEDREKGYWRDVGNLDAYHEGHMDLVSIHPIFNLYNEEWPIYSWHDPLPPAKFVLEEAGRTGQAFDSMVSAGVIVSGGTVRRSVLSPRVHVDAGALVESSVLLDGVTVGERAVVRNAIIDKNVHIPGGFEVGVDRDRDSERFTVSDGGIVVIGKNQKIEAG
ncbi:MAG TPA: glucose-1-phosphate adenylyltransferase [Actinomycetota bacterium]|nr:glucose-1-phosphate adenylyltransferase [Actinomycetota bacterium]